MRRVVIATGGRLYGEPFDRKGIARPTWRAEAEHVRRVIFARHAHAAITRLRQGGATGADRRSREAGNDLGIQVVTYHYITALDLAGGPVRSGNMVEDGADELIAFPGGRGTDECVRLALQAGIYLHDERMNAPKAVSR